MTSVTRTTPRRTPTAALALLALLAAACGGASGGGGGDGGDGPEAAPTSAPPGAVDGTGAGDGTGAEDARAAAQERCPTDALAEVTEPVAITFWHSMGAENEAVLTSLTDAYNASQERVRVELAFQGSYDETAEKYLASLRGGELPQLVQLEETRIQLMIDSGSMLPAQVCIEASEYDLSDHLQPVLDEFTVEDVLWPMPFNVSNPVLYFNTKAFEAAGLDPADPPATFEEVRAAAQQIRDTGAAETGYALELSPWYVEQWFAKADEPLVDNGNGREGRASELLLDNATGEDIFSFVDGLVDDGLALNVGRNPSGRDSLVALGSGQAAMTISTSAALGSIIAILESGAFPDVGLGVGPLPGPTGGGVLVGGAALWIVDEGSTPEESAAAFDYASYLNEPASQAQWHAGTGYLPIRTSSAELPEVADKWAEQPQFRVAYDQLLTSGAEFGGPVVGAYAEMREQIVRGLERIVLEGQEPADALATSVEAANAAIADYNDRVGG